MGDLTGRTVAVTAGRKVEEQADLLRRRGARVVLAPTISTDFLGSDDDVRVATEGALSKPIKYVVLLTGIGLRTWVEAARSWGGDETLLASIRSSTVLARGPKAAAAARKLDIDVAVVAKSERAEELLDVLVKEAKRDDLVVLQKHGGVERRFSSELGARGVQVIEVPLYKWRLPDDRATVERLIEDVIAHRIDAVTFTAAPAVHNLFTIAEEAGRATELLAAFNGGVVAACVGPVCAGAAREEGVTDPAYPEVGRLGLMVRVLAERLATG